MTPLQLAGWLRQAYLSRDVDGHERGLQLLQRATTHPDVRTVPTMPIAGLEERRSELMSELAAVNDALGRARAARAGQPIPTAPPAGATLDPSE